MATVTQPENTQLASQDQLFTNLTEQESAQVGGGCHHYRSYRRRYYRPTAYYRPYYRPYSSYGYGGGINQTVNVTVVVDD